MNTASSIMSYSLRSRIAGLYVLHALKNVFPRQREKPEMPSIAWFISSLFDKGTEKIPKKPKFTGYNVPLDPRTLTESEIVFVMDATKIRILEQPKDFHEALLEHISKAKDRIVLSSLYIDDVKIIKALKEALNNNYTLHVTILLDYYRGIRGGMKSSAGIIKTLVDKFPNRVKACFYKFPMFNEKISPYIPEKLNEVFGSQHIKCYIFDNSLIMSGANLSKEYSINKQDRYYLLSDNPYITRFYTQLVDIVSDFSYKLKPGIVTVKNNDIKNVLDDTNIIINNACRKTIKDEVERHTAVWRAMTNIRNNVIDVRSPQNVLLIPLIQMGIHDIRQETVFFKKLFDGLAYRALKRHHTQPPPDKKYHVYISTAYFNIDPSFLDNISNLLSSEGADCSLITSALSTNPFSHPLLISDTSDNDKTPPFFNFTDKIPLLYTNLQKMVISDILKNNVDSLTLFNYVRDGWIWHAKGMWIFEPFQYPEPTNEHPQVITVIGSSNYGRRSFNRDLESDIVLITSHKDLGSSILKEAKYHTQWLYPVSSETLNKTSSELPLSLKLLTYLLRPFL